MIPPAHPNILGSLPPWALVGMGGAVGWARSFWTLTYSRTLGFFRRKACLSMVVDRSENSDPYTWLSYWSLRVLPPKGNGSFILQWRPTVEPQTPEPAFDADGCPNTPAPQSAFALVPGYGTYHVRYRNRYLLVLDHSKTEAGSSGAYKTTFSITLWGSRDASLLQEILDEAERDYKAQFPKQVYYYTKDHGSWMSHLLPERSLDSVYHPDSMMQDLIEDVGMFLRSREAYAKLGIPYRRGYGFYGHPGTGKTTTAQVLASHFKLPIYYVDVSNPRMDPETLIRAMNNVRPGSIVLMEDIDCAAAALRRSEEKPSGSDGGISMSDLLNVLDGLLAADGRILIMTTNHRDKLDPAVQRAGRVDRWFEFKPAEENALRTFHSRASEVFAIPAWEEFQPKLPENATIGDAQALALGGTTTFVRKPA